MSKSQMSSNNHLLLRQWTMLRMIPRSPKKIAASELLDKLEREGFEVTKRTIERDLQSISAIFPIISDERSKPYGWSWTKDAPTLDLPGLSVSEALTLKLAEQYLTKLMPHSIFESIAPHFLAADKVLNQTSDSNNLTSWTNKISTALPNQQLIAPEIKTGILETLEDALIHNKVLQVTYINQTQAINQTSSSAKIHPLGIVLRGQITYLVCTYEGYSDPRKLAVHRILEANMLEEESFRIPDFNLKDYVDSGTFGFNADDDLQFKGLFTKESAQHMFETPLNLTQNIEALQDHYMITAKVQDTLQFRWWLLSFGKHLVIQEPDSLVSWVKENADGMHQNYGLLQQNDSH